MSASTITSLRYARVAFTGRLAGLSRAAARDLVAHGGGVAVDGVSRRTTVLVVGMAGWPLLPDGTISRKLQIAERLQQTGQRIAIISEERFLELAGRRAPHAEVRKTYTAAAIAELLGIDAATLRRWEQLSLIRSADGHYDFQDIVSLRTLAELVQNGVRPAVIAASLHGLARVLPDTQRPLAQLKLVQENARTLLAELGATLVAADGQLFLNFDAPPTEAAAPQAMKLADDGAADTWFAQAEQLEEQERFAEAVAAYRQGLELRPDDGLAHFNLGNALRELANLDQAATAYQQATTLEPGLAQAWYNLADLQQEEGRYAEAADNLRAALRAAPDYADAHFNLAVCLEQQGREAEARGHWERYLALDRESGWAQHVRERLGTRVPVDKPR